MIIRRILSKGCRKNPVLNGIDGDNRNLKLIWGGLIQIGTGS
jgi:hypothetical protein